MPTPPRKPAARAKLCTATRSDGNPCRNTAVVGLTVCKTHGGNTTASVRKSKLAAASSQAAQLWGISTDAGSISIEAELTKLARNKLTDIIALRVELSREDATHIGLMVESREITDSEVGEEVYRTVKQKKTSTVSPWVKELHDAEKELLGILRLLQEVTGGTEQVDTKRLRMQTAREAVRLAKAFPGLGIDEIASEVSKKAG